MATIIIIHLLLSLLIKLSIFNTTLAINFTCTTFPYKGLLLSGTAAINSGAILLTNDTAAFSVGQAVYPIRVPFRPPNAEKIIPFATSFVFSIEPPSKPRHSGHGMAFVVTTTAGIEGAAAAQHLGLTNSTNDGNFENHLFAIEFDVFRNQELDDINRNHVGVDLNSVKSRAAYEAGYWSGKAGNESFVKLKMNGGDKFRVWIKYVGGRLTVTMAPLNVARPRRPLIKVDVDLLEIFLDEMYVRFAAATGNLVEIESHEVYSWSFITPPYGWRMVDDGTSECMKINGGD